MFLSLPPNYRPIYDFTFSTGISQQMKIEDIRILVVDDFSTMRKIIKAMLRKIGIKSIDDAEDGKFALNLLKS